jgi:hypothetical protein
LKANLLTGDKTVSARGGGHPEVGRIPSAGRGQQNGRKKSQYGGLEPDECSFHIWFVSV